MSRDIIVAAKIGGPDPQGNFRLRTAIERAKTEGMPNDNIKRAIEKGAGIGSSDNMESMSYEGYGPGGVAIFIEAMTDNKNRTAGDIRSYFNKYNGNLGSDGCVAWIFSERGLIQVPQMKVAEEDLFEKALDAGASDFEADEDGEFYTIYTDPETLNGVCQALSDANIPIASAEVTRIPQNSVNITDPAHATQLMKLLDAIEGQDDVQAVYANFDMDESLLEQSSK